MYINYKYKTFQSNPEAERGKPQTKALKDAKAREIFESKADFMLISLFHVQIHV